MSKTASYCTQIAAVAVIFLMVVSGFAGLGEAAKDSAAPAAPGFEDLFGQMVEQGDFTADDVKETLKESEDGSEYEMLELEDGFVILKGDELVYDSHYPDTYNPTEETDVGLPEVSEGIPDPVDEYTDVSSYDVPPEGDVTTGDDDRTTMMDKDGNIIYTDDAAPGELTGVAQGQSGRTYNTIEIDGEYFTTVTGEAEAMEAREYTNMYTGEDTFTSIGTPAGDQVTDEILEDGSVFTTAPEPEPVDPIEGLPELVDKRDLWSKTYDKGNGEFVAAISVTPIHYYDEASGTYKDIDTTLERSGASYVNTENVLESEFSADGVELVRAETGRSMSFAVTEMGFAGEGTYTLIQSAQPSTPEVDGNEINYPGVFPQTTEQYIVLYGELKQNFILTGLVDAPEGAEYLQFRMEYDISGLDIYSGDKKMTGNFFTMDGIGFYDESTDELAFGLAPGVAYDSGEQLVQLFYDVEIDGDEVVIYLNIPLEFFEDAEYPVIVDPTTYIYPNYYGFTYRYRYYSSTSYYGPYSSSYGYVGVTSGSSYYDYIRRSFVRWDTSTIVDGSTVSYIQYRTYWYRSYNYDWPHYIYVYDLINNPQYAGGQTLWNDCGGGSLYGAIPMQSTSYGQTMYQTKYLTLSTAARTMMQNQLGSNWFGVGLRQSFEGLRPSPYYQHYDYLRLYSSYSRLYVSYTLPAQPDLIVEKVYTDASSSWADEQNTFKAKVKNIGQATAGTSYTYWYVDGNYRTSTYTPSLGIGQSTVVSGTFTGPAQGGYSMVKAKADGPGSMLEKSETNNEKDTKFCFFEKPNAEAGDDVEADEGEEVEFDGSDSQPGIYDCETAGGSAGNKILYIVESSPTSTYDAWYWNWLNIQKGTHGWSVSSATWGSSPVFSNYDLIVISVTTSTTYNRYLTVKSQIMDKGIRMMAVGNYADELLERLSLGVDANHGYGGFYFNYVVGNYAGITTGYTGSQNMCNSGTGGSISGSTIERYIGFNGRALLSAYGPSSSYTSELIWSVWDKTDTFNGRSPGYYTGNLDTRVGFYGQRFSAANPTWTTGWNTMMGRTVNWLLEDTGSSGGGGSGTYTGQFDMNDLSAASSYRSWSRFTARCVDSDGKFYVRASQSSSTIYVFSDLNTFMTSGSYSSYFTLSGMTPYGQMFFLDGKIYYPYGTSSTANGVRKYDVSTSTSSSTSLPTGTYTWGWGGYKQPGIATDGDFIYHLTGNIVRIYDKSESYLRQVTLPQYQNSFNTIFAAGHHLYTVDYTGFYSTSGPCKIEYKVNAETGTYAAYSDYLLDSPTKYVYLVCANYDYFGNNLLVTNGNPQSYADRSFVIANAGQGTPQGGGGGSDCYSEDFEGALPGWTTGYIGSSYYGPSHWTIRASAFSGSPTFPSKTYGSDGNGNGWGGSRSDAEHSYILSPKISLGAAPVTMSFKSWSYDEGGSYYDSKYVEISTDGGSTWTNLAPYPYQQLHGYADGTWRDITFDPAKMDIYANKDVYLRFRYETKDSCCSFEKGWYVDDLSLCWSEELNLSYRWNFGDGSGWTPWSDEPEAKHIFPDGPKEYTVTLQFNDGKYNSTDTGTVKVANIAPTIDEDSGTIVTSPADEGSWVTFKDFQFSDPGDTSDLPYTYEWDFNDDGVIDASGQITTGTNPFTIPAKSFFYDDDFKTTVKLTVRDKDDGKVFQNEITDDEYIAGIDQNGYIYRAVSNGDGTFGSVQYVAQPISSNGRGIGIADFDNDGDLDIVASYYYGYVYYLEKNGVGNSYATPDYLGDVGYCYYDISVGDFNEDGNMDFILLRNTGSSYNKFFQGNGDGTFTMKTMTTSGNYWYCYGTTVGDFNEDGHLDIMIAYSRYAYLLKGNGDGTFQNPVTAATHPGSYTVYFIASGDFNGDDHLDVILGDYRNGQLYRFYGTGTGTFGGASYVMDVSPYTYGYTCGDAYDFNDDGKQDLVALNYHYYGYAYRYMGTGSGTFGTSSYVGDFGYYVYCLSAPTESGETVIEGFDTHEVELEVNNVAPVVNPGDNATVMYNPAQEGAVVSVDNVWFFDPGNDTYEYNVIWGDGNETGWTSLGSSASGAEVFTNPSFESGSTGWTYKEATVYSFGLGYYNGAITSGWSTDDSNSYRLWCQPNTVTKRTDYCRIEQDIDLTGISSLKMDIKTGKLFLQYAWGPTWDYNFQVRVYIDSNIEWKTKVKQGVSGGDENKVFTDVELDVSGYTGTHKFVFELYETENGTNMGGNTFEAWLDNLRAFAPSGGEGLYGPGWHVLPTINYTYADDHPASGTPGDLFPVSVQVRDDDHEEDSGSGNKILYVTESGPTTTYDAWYWNWLVSQATTHGWHVDSDQWNQNPTWADYDLIVMSVRSSTTYNRYSTVKSQMLDMGIRTMFVGNYADEMLERLGLSNDANHGYGGFYYNTVQGNYADITTGYSGTVYLCASGSGGSISGSTIAGTGHPSAGNFDGHHLLSVLGGTSYSFQYQSIWAVWDIGDKYLSGTGLTSKVGFYGQAMSASNPSWNTVWHTMMGKTVNWLLDGTGGDPVNGLGFWNFTQQVDNAAPTFNATAVDINPGTTIDEHTEITMNGLKFTDPAIEVETEEFQYKVDWGDGTTTGWFDFGAAPTKVKSVLFWEDLPVSTNIGYQDYRTAIQAYGATFTRVTTNPTVAQMQTYDLVFYYNGGIIGPSWPSMTDINLMKSYLDAGGKMVWAGNFPTYYASAVGYASFMQTYFGVQYYNYHYFYGSVHNMVGDDGNLEITGNWPVNWNHPEIYLNYYFHEVPNLVSGHTKEMHCQSYASQATMVSTEGSGFDTVCWSFDLNLVDSSTNQADLMTKVLDWFGGAGGGLDIIKAEGGSVTEDFEIGMGDWSATGLWHVTNYRSHSPSASAAFNSESDHQFLGDNWGYLTSGTFDLTGADAPHLKFWSWQQTENGAGTGNYYDRRDVQISTNGGTSWATLPWTGSNLLSSSYMSWHQYDFDLSAYASSTDFRVRFFFDSGDSLFNYYEGWYVDDIELTGMPNEELDTVYARFPELTHMYWDDNPTNTPVDVYNLKAYVRDDDLGLGMWETDITVNNVAPGVDGVKEYEVDEGGVVTFKDYTFEDPGANDTWWYLWDFGDGSTTDWQYLGGSTIPNHPVGDIGPDDYGYTADDGATYSWVDATGGTKQSVNGYSGYSEVDLPWSFEFYGEEYDSLSISSNGFVDFGEPNTVHAYTSNYELPDDYAYHPNNAIYVYWDYTAIYTSYGSGVYTKEGSDSHGDYFCIEWYRAYVPYYYYTYGSSYQITYELLLYEDGSMKMQYQDTYTSYTYYAYGNSATIGIENADGTDGLEYSYNQQKAYSGDAIGFYPPNKAKLPEIPEVSHRYIDDHPMTGTPSDVMDAHLYVRDDDTGLGEVNQVGGSPWPGDYAFSEPEYAWNTNYGSNIGAYDDSTHQVDLGFGFNFYGTDYDQVYVGSNGALSFTQSYISLGNYDFPSSSSSADQTIAVLWDDLNPGYSGGVYYNTIGTPGDQVFMVSWLNVPRYYYYGSYTFQALLYEATGEIRLNYATVNTGGYTGVSPTVGLNEGDGVHYNEQHYGTLDLPDAQTSYLYTPPELDPYINIDVQNVDPFILYHEDPWGTEGVNELSGFTFKDPGTGPNEVWDFWWDLDGDGVKNGPNTDIVGTVTDTLVVDYVTYGTIPTLTLPYNDDYAGTATLYVYDDDMERASLMKAAPDGNFMKEALSSQWNSNYGTKISTIGDDTTHQFNLGFDFDWYGTDYDKLWLGSNGALSFTQSYITLSNYDLPNTYSYTQDIVAPLWDDLNPFHQYVYPWGTYSYGNGDVYTNTYGTPGDRVFMATWLNVARYSNSGQHSFQVLFFENGAEIQFNYLKTGNEYQYLSPTIGLNKGDGALYSKELYGSGYGTTFGLPQSLKYFATVPRTFYKTFNVTMENDDPVIDNFEITVDINLKLRVSGVKWHMVTLEVWEDNVLTNTSVMIRDPSTPTDNIVTGDPMLYRFHVNRDYTLKLKFDGSANAIGSSPVWLLLDWPDDDHTGDNDWDMTSSGLGNHDDYWDEDFNINHGGVTQMRSLWVDPARFFWDHVVKLRAKAHDDGSDDLKLTYYTSTQIPPIRGPLNFWNNGVGPEPVAYTPFTGTAPFHVKDQFAWQYNGGQTITLVVNDDDGGSDMKSLVIT